MSYCVLSDTLVIDFLPLINFFVLDVINAPKVSKPYVPHVSNNFLM